MRRTIALVAAFAAAIGMTLAIAGVASADEGPHGGYGFQNAYSGAWSSTDKCAGCHRAHTAAGDNLLVGTTTTNLCAACHGTTGQGADTDVWDGVYTSTGRGDLFDAINNGVNANGVALNGGGFQFAFNRNSNSFATVTSIHGVDGITFGGSVEDGNDIAWGGGSAIGVSGKLECTSCHDPHGSYNYRLLNKGSAGHGALSTWATGAATFLKNNVYSDQVTPSTGVGGVAHNYTSGINVAYDRGISDFCASCHTNYVRDKITDPNGQLYQWNYATSGPGSSAASTYRHPVSAKAVWDASNATWNSTLGHWANNEWIATGATFGLRRVAADQTATNGTNVTCLTCHQAHGSSAAFTGEANPASNTTYPMVINDSGLLFLDNRGVCNQCHVKPSGTELQSSGYTSGGSYVAP